MMEKSFQLMRYAYQGKPSKLQHKIDAFAWNMGVRFAIKYKWYRAIRETMR